MRFSGFNVGLESVIKVIRKGVGNVTKNGKALLKCTKYVAKKFECQCSTVAHAWGD